jgi:hypothetical protein
MTAAGLQVAHRACIFVSLACCYCHCEYSWLPDRMEP